RDRQRMLEPGREGCYLRRCALTQVHARHLPAGDPAEVLAPFGDVEIAVPERQAVGGRVRLEVGDRPIDSAAAPAQLLAGVARPAGGPAEAAGPPDPPPPPPPR